MIMTTAIKKLLKLKSRTRIVQGGTWAGKSTGIIAILIDYATRNTGEDITVVAETIPSVRRGVLRDFLKIMKVMGRYQENSYNATQRMYTFQNGTTIEFTAFDTVEKAMQAGKRDVLYINEPQSIAKDICFALMDRTTKYVWIDFNPVARFWVHTDEIKDKDFIVLTYRDNEAIPDNIKKLHNHRRELAKTSDYWSNWCNVYLDGEVGNLEGAVFSFQIVDRIPEQADLLGYGMDFGFTNHVTAIVALYRMDKSLYINELEYRVGLFASDIIKTLKNNEVKLIIVADRTSPREIADIRRHGFKITKSLGYAPYKGLHKLQEWQINITASSSNCITEFERALWKKNKDGTEVNEIQGDDHAIDAVRYIAENKLFKKTFSMTV